MRAAITTEMSALSKPHPWERLALAQRPHMRDAAIAPWRLSRDQPQETQGVEIGSSLKAPLIF
jgi:hypothetical protein